MKEIVAVLMAYGANPGIANYEGDLPSGLPPPSLVVRTVIMLISRFHIYFGISSVFCFTDGSDEKVQEGQLTFARNGDNLN